MRVCVYVFVYAFEGVLEFGGVCVLFAKKNGCVCSCSLCVLRCVVCVWFCVLVWALVRVFVCELFVRVFACVCLSSVVCVWRVCV